MACSQANKVQEVLEVSVTAVTLGVPMVLAAGEGVTPTGNDRCGDRGRGAPLYRIQIPPKGGVCRKPLCGAPNWVLYWRSLSLIRASERQGDSASQSWFLRQCSMSAASTRLESQTWEASLQHTTLS